MIAAATTIAGVVLFAAGLALTAGIPAAMIVVGAATAAIGLFAIDDGSRS